MSNPLIAKYNTAGTYTIEVETGLYQLTLVGGGGNAYYATTGDADGGYAYTRGWGGGSGGAFSAVILLPKGTYTVVIGGVAGRSYITDPNGETVVSVGGGGNAGSWAVGAAGAAPTVNSNYTVLGTTINKAGNAGLTAKGDWGSGYGTGGASVYSSYGTGASINSGGSWGRTDGGFELLTYTESKYNKFYALKKDVFDINKVTVVGNPTITSDGVLSNESQGNHVKPISLTFNIQQATIMEIEFETGEDITTEQKMFSQDSNYQLGISNTQIYVTYSLNWVYAGANTIKANTRYKAIVSYKDNKLLLKLKELNTTSYTEISRDINPSNTNINNTTFGGAFNGSLPFLGKIYLDSFRFYIDGDLTYSPTKPTYLLERRKPKVWNKGQFTIVGNPSISGSGIASGFSGSDYLRILLTILSDSKWEIQGKLPQDLSQNGTLFGFSNNQYSRLYISNMRLYNTIIGFKTANDTVSQVIDCNIALTQEMAGKFFKYGFDGSHLYLEVEGANPILVAMYSMASDLTYVNIGTNNNFTSIFTGSIDLKSIKITADNTLIFDGGAETYVYDPSKFTIVGSPTITEYGVASGFSTTNYIKTSGFNIGQLKGKSWEIKCKWYFDVNTTDTYNINDILNLSETYHSNGYMGANTSNKRLRIMIATGVTGASQIFYQESTSIAESGWVEQKLTFDVNTGAYTFYNLKPNSTIWESREWVATTENKELLVINERPSDCFQIGRGKDAIIGYTPVILPSISITVDSKEVFTGAKEEFYMLRR